VAEPESPRSAEPVASSAPTRRRASRSRLVAAAPSAVWETLAAFDQIGLWAKQVDRASYTTEVTHGLGATRRVQAGILTLFETITAWEPRRELAYSIAGAPPVVRHVTNSWQLDAVAGGTLVTVATVIEPRRSFIGTIAAAVFCRVMTMTSEKLLADLVAYHALDHP